MTDVTIRGIDDDVYQRFSAEARKRGLPIGELVTLVMRALVEEPNDSNRISHISNVTVNEEDLNGLDGTVSFLAISSLTFQTDVSWETFEKHVEDIEEVGRLTVPATFPRLRVLMKCRQVGRIIQSR